MRYYDALQSIGPSRDTPAMYRRPDSKTPREQFCQSIKLKIINTNLKIKLILSLAWRVDFW